MEQSPEADRVMVAGEDDSGSGSQRQPPSGSAHYLAKYVLRSSAVLHAVPGHFRSSESNDVVFGKETSLELLVIDEDGVLQSVIEQPVFGIIKDLAALRWSDSYVESRMQKTRKDILVVLSDSGKLSFLAFSFEMHRFLAMAHIELSKPGNALNQLGRMLVVDPTGCFIAVSAFEDQFAFFSMSKFSGDIIDEKIFYPLEIGETSLVKDTMKTTVPGTIWSMCFVSHGIDHSGKGYYPILATIMHRKGRLKNELLLFGCTLRTRTIQFISSYPEAEVGPLAQKICSVPHLSGFAFLFRLGDALLMDFNDPYCIRCVQRINIGLPGGIDEPGPFDDSSGGMDIDDEGMSNVAVSALLELSDSAAAMAKDVDPMSTECAGSFFWTSKHVCSYSWVPTESSSLKLIFCLDTGEIQILDIHSNIDGISVYLSECLFKYLPCKELIWVKGGFVVGLTEMGDGLVLKLDGGGLTYKSPIQNAAPILDLVVVGDPDEKQDQMFACCGMSPSASLRVICSGVTVEKLVKTPPVYQGITGTWTLRMSQSDPYHAFLVLSFVEETRVLSVGLSFFDVTDATGFQPDVCTLACGLVADGLLVQIHRMGVRLCFPTTAAHVKGVPLSTPLCTSWQPDNLSISLGAVGQNVIAVATSNPCYLYLLGIKSLTECLYDIIEIQHLRLQHEVSCISIPEQYINFLQLSSAVKLGKKDGQVTNCTKCDTRLILVIGTHTPSVEVISFADDEGFRFLASGTISVDNALGTPISSCIPEDVRLVLVDKCYILAGLRNGMLLRFEWPATSVSGELEQTRPIRSEMTFFGMLSSTSLKKDGNFRPVLLQLIAIRSVGTTPVVLVPLQDSLDADVIVLSDRPWLLHVERYSLVYTSVSFQPATHTTSVSSFDCPAGVFFVADNRLHLVEFVRGKRLNARKFSIEGNPRKVLFHKESRTLLVLRTGLRGTITSDICRVDAISGVILSKFPCELGEIAKCMEIIKIGYQHLLVVGTSQCTGRTVMPSGEPESGRGRLIVINLDDPQKASDSSSLIYCSNLSPDSQISLQLHGIVGSISDYYCGDGIRIDNIYATRLRSIYQNQLSGAVLSVCSYLDRYILASAGNTDLKKLEQLYSDPVQRLVADCTLVDMDTAVVSDRRGSISGLFSYKFPLDNMFDYDDAGLAYKSLHNSIVASTLLGSILMLVPVTGEEHALLEAVQAKLAVHPLTAPLLGNDHKEYRARGSQAGVPTMLDGDMLVQFLELTRAQQEAVLSLPSSDNGKASAPALQNPPVTVNQVLQILEKIHYALS
ncbi:DNA damage-binding protein 1b [Apostasia shenzhenica]|uniref:DNA damage-binding protein 1b n=1 Tax=Apostasia shenzhenica TaxID=1088818 RepID=A0A2I0AAE8_9ASPA|nr:DNA damage-binding protein 1b [Apostasia shenzhenica]